MSSRTPTPESTSFYCVFSLEWREGLLGKDDTSKPRQGTYRLRAFRSSCSCSWIIRIMKTRIFFYISDRTIEKNVPASKNWRTYWYLNMWLVKFLAKDGKSWELSKLQSVLNLKLSTTPSTSKERLKRKRNKRNANLKRRRYVLILSRGQKTCIHFF